MSHAFAIRKDSSRIGRDAKEIADLVKANVPAPMRAAFMAVLSMKLHNSIRDGNNMTDVMNEVHKILHQN